MAAVYKPTCGVQEDFESLLKDFVASKSVRFEDFSTLWRERRMSLIFCGRQDDLECREFTEDCLRIASEFWMLPYSFQTRIGALYLMYCLHAKQPFNPKAKVRVTMDMWCEADSLLQDIHQQQHLDVEYIFRKMQYEGTFQYVASVHPQSIGSSLLDTNQAGVGSEPTLTEQTQNVLVDLMQSDQLQTLQLLHNRYAGMKSSLATPISSSLDMIHTDLFVNIKRMVSVHESWVKSIEIGQQQQTSTEVQEKDITVQKTSKSRRQTIKDRAYSNVVVASRSRRYRQAITEDATDNIPSPQKKKKKASNSLTQNTDDEDEICPQGDDVTGVPTERTSGLLHMPKLTTSDDDDDDMPLCASNTKKKSLDVSNNGGATERESGKKGKSKSKTPPSGKGKKGGKLKSKSSKSK